MKKYLNVVSILILSIAIVLGGGFLAKAISDNVNVTVNDGGVGIQNSYAGDTQPSPAKVGYSNQEGGFVVTKLLDYQDIVTSGVDITNTVNGTLYLSDLIIETDDVALASGTDFIIEVNGDTYGGTNQQVFKTLVSKLVASTTMDLYTSSTNASTTQRVILEDGSKLIAKCTAADCNQDVDDGTMRITMFFDKVTPTGYIHE